MQGIRHSLAHLAATAVNTGNKSPLPSGAVHGIRGEPAKPRSLQHSGDSPRGRSSAPSRPSRAESSPPPRSPDHPRCVARTVGLIAGGGFSLRTCRCTGTGKTGPGDLVPNSSLSPLSSMPEGIARRPHPRRAAVETERLQYRLFALPHTRRRVIPHHSERRPLDRHRHARDHPHHGPTRPPG